VSLRPGRNVIIVKAVNLAGSTRTASVTVNYKAPPCRVPKLQSKTLSAAIRALARADCTLGKVKQVRSRRFRKGHVISSRPKAGTRHRPLYRVGLVVSRGR
jgi:beta-lactam-binding protein with PASTA domain